MTNKERQIKYLLSAVQKRDIKEKNICRMELGLPLIQIKIIKCSICQVEFESIGNRICKSCHKKEKRFHSYGDMGGYTLF